MGWSFRLVSLCIPSTSSVGTVSFVGRLIIMIVGSTDAILHHYIKLAAFSLHARPSEWWSFRAQDHPFPGLSRRGINLGELRCMVVLLFSWAKTLTFCIRLFKSNVFCGLGLHGYILESSWLCKPIIYASKQVIFQGAFSRFLGVILPGTLDYTLGTSMPQASISKCFCVVYYSVLSMSSRVP